MSKIKVHSCASARFFVHCFRKHQFFFCMISAVSISESAHVIESLTFLMEIINMVLCAIMPMNFTDWMAIGLQCLFCRYKCRNGSSLSLYNENRWLYKHCSWFYSFNFHLLISCLTQELRQNINYRIWLVAPCARYLWKIVEVEKTSGMEKKIFEIFSISISHEVQY